MIKKLVCLLLLLTCSFALFACDGEDTPPQDTPPAETQLPDAEFFEMVKNSDPNMISTVTTTTDKNTKIPYNGKYDTYIEEDGSYRFEYEYQLALPVSLENIGKPSAVETKNGTILYKDGLYSTDGENWGSAAPETDVLNVKLDLNRDYIGEYKMSKDGKTLTATVSAENAEKILGVKINATKDVVIKISTNGTYLSRIIVDYENKAATVKIDTSYAYVPAQQTPAEPA